MFAVPACGLTFCDSARSGTMSFMDLLSIGTAETREAESVEVELLAVWLVEGAETVLPFVATVPVAPCMGRAFSASPGVRTLPGVEMELGLKRLTRSSAF